MKRINSNELYAVIVSSIPFLYIGITSGLSTEYIYEQEINGKKDEEDISWIGASGLMLSFVGSLVVGYLMDKFGRRTLFFLTYAINFVGWMIIAFTKYFLLGRILISLTVGMAPASAIYVAEILQPEHRGTFLSIESTLEILGSLFVYLIGYCISIKTSSLMLGIAAAFLFIFSFYIPETPYWYMLKRRKGEATKSLIWLRKGNELTIDRELCEIEKNLINTNKVDHGVFEIIFNLKWWRLFLLFSVYLLFTELTGFDMIIPYSVQFFAKFNRTEIDSKIISIIFMVVTFAGTIGTVFIVERFERTSLVIYGNLMNVFLLSISAICEMYFNTYASSVISIICFCIFGTTVSITAFTLPWTIISENLPTEFRATILAVLATEFSLTYFLFTKLFPDVLQNCPISYIIWSFAVFSLLTCIFVRYFVKETRGIILS